MEGEDAPCAEKCKIPSTYILNAQKQKDGGIKRERSNIFYSQPPTTYLTPFNILLKVRSRHVSVNI
jgi:hypothetical protein